MKLMVRLITLQDLDAFCEMTQEADIGFYTMPKDRKVAKARLQRAILSNELYLFVVEDRETNTIVGTSAIEATTGGTEPLYFYKKRVLTVQSDLQQAVKAIPILDPISYVHGPTELCALFVRPQFRKSGVGKLLSFARFLFIAKFKERFTDTLFAQLRGFLDDSNTSPFWEGVGRHFLDMSFTEVLSLYQYGRSFISQVLPSFPIYLKLLPQEVQNVVGKIDRHTEGALTLLKQIGFEVTDEVDVLDGAPKLCALQKDISIIQKSKTYQIGSIQKKIDLPITHILTNERLEFRACYAAFDSVQAAISDEVAKLLEVQAGDTIRGYPL